jgi:hypothetical protein
LLATKFKKQSEISKPKKRKEKKEFSRQGERKTSSKLVKTVLTLFTLEAEHVGRRKSSFGRDGLVDAKATLGDASS